MIAFVVFAALFAVSLANPSGSGQCVVPDTAEGKFMLGCWGFFFKKKSQCHNLSTANQILFISKIGITGMSGRGRDGTVEFTASSETASVGDVITVSYSLAPL